MLRLTLGSLLSDILVIVLIFDALQTERKAPYIGSGTQNEFQNFKLKDKIQLMRTLQLFRLVEFLVDSPVADVACLLSAEKARFLLDKVWCALAFHHVFNVC